MCGGEIVPGTADILQISYSILLACNKQVTQYRQCVDIRIEALKSYKCTSYLSDVTSCGGEILPHRHNIPQFRKSTLFACNNQIIFPTLALHRQVMHQVRCQNESFNDQLSYLGCPSLVQKLNFCPYTCKLFL